MTPPKLALRFQSPTYPTQRNQTPISSYSKGSRGLSVLLQLTSIFTRTSISLSLWLRQWGSRYAIRAGRNLPDKEFRYLRTVIVTAAVYWGLGSQLRLQLTGPLNLPAPGRRHSVYIVLRLRTTAVFLVNSRYPLVLCHPLSSRASLSPKGHSFSRSYGCNLPSSLTRVLSIALVFSTRPPVSVWGTGSYESSLAAFLGSMDQ